MDFLELLNFARAKNFISAQIDEQIQILYTMKIQSTEQTKTNQSTLAQTDDNALKQDILLKWINQNLDKCKGLMKNLTANTPKGTLRHLTRLVIISFISLTMFNTIQQILYFMLNKAKTKFTQKQALNLKQN